MKIGIVSDTHDNLEKTERIVDFLEDRVEKVIHCGDVVAPFTAELFDADFDFYAVRGNNDGEWKLMETVEEFGTYLGQSGEIEFDGVKFGVYHGTREEIADAMTRSGKYDYVLRGHTHQKKVREHGETVELNPGGIAIEGAGEPIHVIVMDTRTDELEFHEV
ncbi:MAG: metallophosphoesterase [Candidatus Nanohaloarchaea archaeon]